MTPGTVLVVGAGLAGVRCAETLRAEGFSGRIVVAGEEDVPPYERPALSKDFLTGERSPEQLWLRPDRFWADNGIELQLATHVTHVDVRGRRAFADDGRALPWDALVLASGARAPAHPGAAPAGAHLLRRLADALAVRRRLRPGRRLAVVGAGLVGGEVATSAAALGLDVVAIDRNPAPLARTLGPDAGALLADRYRASGIELVTAARPAGFETGARGELRALRLEDGRRLACDAAVVGIGAVPAVPIWLARGHVGVATDECGATKLPGVFACGDAARWWSPRLRRRLRSGHWTAAAAQGAAVARRILGRPEPYDEPPYFWSDQLGLRLQCLGHPDLARATEVDGDGDSFAVRYLGRGGELVGALLANRPREAATLRRELAAA